MNTFAERLKYAMEQADLKQSALSEQAGISKAAISQYLSGKNTPNQERIKALADVTGVTFDFLISLCGSAFSVGFCPSAMPFPAPGTTGITTLTPPSSGSMWALKPSTPSLA